MDLVHPAFSQKIFYMIFGASLPKRYESNSIQEAVRNCRFSNSHIHVDVKDRVNLYIPKSLRNHQVNYEMRLNNTQGRTLQGEDLEVRLRHENLATILISSDEKYSCVIPYRVFRDSPNLLFSEYFQTELIQLCGSRDTPLVITKVSSLSR